MIEIAPVTDAGKMALLFAMRRDWRASPSTVNYGPAMVQVLIGVAMQIDAEQEARGFLSEPEGSDTWTSPF
jgi:hypothetical protein